MELVTLILQDKHTHPQTRPTGLRSVLPTHRVTLIRAERHPHHTAAPVLPHDATRLWEFGMQLVRRRVWDTATTYRLRYSTGNKQANKRQHKQKSQPTHSGRYCCTALLQASGGRTCKLVAGMLKCHLCVVWGSTLVEAHCQTGFCAHQQHPSCCLPTLHASQRRCR